VACVELIRLIGEDFDRVKLAGEDLFAADGRRLQFLRSTGSALRRWSFRRLISKGRVPNWALLIHETEQFCKDPINIVMTEKRFMARKFLAPTCQKSPRDVFNQARASTEHRSIAVLLPLETQNIADPRSTAWGADSIATKDQ
jgi:hypothetical protein